VERNGGSVEKHGESVEKHGGSVEKHGESVERTGESVATLTSEERWSHGAAGWRGRGRVVGSAEAELSVVAPVCAVGHTPCQTREKQAASADRVWFTIGIRQSAIARTPL
jgi:hypothetical protein